MIFLSRLSPAQYSLTIVFWKNQTMTCDAETGKSTYKEYRAGALREAKSCKVSHTPCQISRFEYLPGEIKRRPFEPKRDTVPDSQVHGGKEADRQ